MKTQGYADGIRIFPDAIKLRFYKKTNPRNPLLSMPLKSLSIVNRPCDMFIRWSPFILQCSI